MPIEINIYPDPLIVAAELDRLATDIEVEPGPMGDSLDILMASIDRAFSQQGPGWEPWSESYAASRGHGHGPLLEQDTILIRDAALITSTQDPANYVVAEDSIAWDGAAAPDYSDFHLTGTEKMPERNFLRVDATAAREILGTWSDWLGRKVKVVRG